MSLFATNVIPCSSKRPTATDRRTEAYYAPMHPLALNLCYRLSRIPKPTSSAPTVVGRELINSEKHNCKICGERDNTVPCLGLGFYCRYILTRHHDCAAFIPVTKSRSVLLAWLIRFRTHTAA